MIRPSRRPTAPVLISIAVHSVVAALFVSAIVAPADFGWVTGRSAQEPEERIRFVSVPPRPVEAPPRAQRPSAPPQSRLVFTPGSAAPTASIGPPTGSGSGTGSGGDPGATGAVSLEPSAAATARIFGALSTAPIGSTIPDTPEATLRRSIWVGLDSVNAVAAVAAEKERRVLTIGPTDWKLAIDSGMIHIGKYSVPAAVLGFIPIANSQVLCLQDGCRVVTLENPNLSDRAKRIAEMSDEIRRRAPIEAAARAEIRRIAARKDAERAARLAAPPPERPLSRSKAG